jgi:hypothetical protein
MKTIEMLETIFNMVTKETYDMHVIEEYEGKYKTKVMEALADYCDGDEEMEDSILFNYNGENLVHYFKKQEKSNKKL